MNSRQRVLNALNHKVPDRVPIDFGGFQSGIHKKAYLTLINYLGIEDELNFLDPIQQLARPCEQLLERFRADIRYISAKQFFAQDRHNKLNDEFGVPWTMQNEYQNYMHVSYHPLAEASTKDIEAYSFPKSHDKSYFDGIREKALKISDHASYALCTDTGGSIFEPCCNLRGTEKWFIDTKEEPDFCEALLDKVLEYWLEFYSGFLKETGDIIDIVMIGDDLAGQNGPLFSLEFYRNALKPRQRKLVSHIKSFTNARICYHTCGSCYEFIPDLIDIGIDILNPIQTGLKNMEPQKIKDEFGTKIALWGAAIDAQQLLLFSGPAQIKPHVRKNIEIFKSGGGYIFSNTHNIQFDVPPENIVALFDAAYEFGS
ncbi:MAG: uroporphyrinogen decarboxylase family protein [Sedimentisphaerales bacterium]